MEKDFHTSSAGPLFEQEVLQRGRFIGSRTGTRTGAGTPLLVAVAQAFAAAAQAKDSHTGVHVERVRQIVRSMAEILELNPQMIFDLELAALLHDVGKIGIENEILMKPSPLNAEEYEKIKSHPQIANDILDGVDEFRGALQILRSHHERPDGHGYPDRLVADEIPVASRLLSVADAYDAMTSDRPYRRGTNTRAALTELRRHVGTQFFEVAVWSLEVAIDRGLIETLG